MICTILTPFKVTSKVALAKILLTSACLLVTPNGHFISEGFAEAIKQNPPLTKDSSQKRVKQTFKEPEVRAGSKIAIVVDHNIITEQEIEDRVNLVLFSSGLENTGSNQKTVREQVKQALINEKIQLKVIQLQKVVVTDREAQEALANIARDNRMTAPEMEKKFADNKVNIATLKNRLRIQIGWARTIRQAFSGLVHVSDREVEAALNKFKETRNEEQYELLEIVLRVEDYSHQGKVKAAADDIYKQLKKGANFQVLAQQFSEATSSTTGGYVGWFVKSQLEPNLQKTIANLKVGEFSLPLETAAGYKIFYLKDTMKAGRAASQEMISYKQVLIPYHDAMTPEEQTKIEHDLAELEKVKTAQDFEKKAQDSGYDCQTFSAITFGSLPPPLQTLLRDCKVGKILGPIRTPESLLMMMVSNREQALAKFPTSDEMRDRLEQNQYSNFANREFNKVLAAAHIQDKTSSAS